MARSAVSNFLSAPQIWAWWTRLKQLMIKKKKHCIGDFWQYMLLSSYLVSAFHSFLKSLRYTQRQRVVTLKMHNLGLECLVTAHFWPFVTLVCVSTDTSGTIDQDQLIHRCVMQRRQVFLNFAAEPCMVRIDLGLLSANTKVFTFVWTAWVKHASLTRKCVAFAFHSI